jgi:hypothetical protein
MDLGSGIRKKPIPDPGVKKAPDPGSGSATLAITKSTVLNRNRINVRQNYVHRIDIDPDRRLLINHIRTRSCYEHQRQEKKFTVVCIGFKYYFLHGYRTDIENLRKDERYTIRCRLSI